MHRLLKNTSYMIKLASLSHVKSNGLIILGYDVFTHH